METKFQSPLFQKVDKCHEAFVKFLGGNFEWEVAKCEYTSTMYLTFIGSKNKIFTAYNLAQAQEEVNKIFGTLMPIIVSFNKEDDGDGDYRLFFRIML